LKIIRRISELKDYFDHFVMIERDSPIDPNCIEINNLFLCNIRFSDEDLCLISGVCIRSSIFYECSFDSTSDSSFEITEFRLRLDYSSENYFINCTFNVSIVSLQVIDIMSPRFSSWKSRERFNGVRFINSYFRGDGEVIVENVPTTLSFNGCEMHTLKMCTTFKRSRIYINSSIIDGIILGFSRDGVGFFSYLNEDTLSISNSLIGIVVASDSYCLFEGRSDKETPTGYNCSLKSLLSDNVDNFYIHGYFNNLDLSGISLGNSVLIETGRACFSECDVSGLDLSKTTFLTSGINYKKSNRVIFRCCSNVDKIITPPSSERGLFPDDNFYYVTLPVREKC